MECLAGPWLGWNSGHQCMIDTCTSNAGTRVQEHGETLTTAWKSTLAILEDAATRRDDSARVVRLGHECLELLVADFLAALPRPLLRRALHVEACFVMQAMDVNTCYAASLSLWRAADTIGRVLAAHMHATPAALDVRALLTPKLAPARAFGTHCLPCVFCIQPVQLSLAFSPPAQTAVLGSLARIRA